MGILVVWPKLLSLPSLLRASPPKEGYRGSHLPRRRLGGRFILLASSGDLTSVTVGQDGGTRTNPVDD